jgi:hypothetical protein
LTTAHSWDWKLTESGSASIQMLMGAIEGMEPSEAASIMADVFDEGTREELLKVSVSSTMRVVHVTRQLDALRHELAQLAARLHQSDGEELSSVSRTAIIMKLEKLAQT